MYNDEKKVEPLKIVHTSVKERRELEKRTGNVSSVAMGGMTLKSIVQIVQEQVLRGCVLWGWGEARAAGEG